MKLLRRKGGYEYSLTTEYLGYDKMKDYFIKLFYLITYHFVRPKLIVLQANFSGDESFIDIRYWLSRPDKINHKITPYLLTTNNQRLGLMHLSKFGAVRSQLRKHTNNGIILFYNKDHAVRKGDKIALYWDGFKADDIEVK